MGLFGKIKEILFDEETVEIPVITKEEKVEKAPREKVKDSVTRVKKNESDDVIIKKIETPKRETKTDDLLFDMPKFKEEVKEEKKANSFSFPVFGDDEIKEQKREKRSSKKASLSEEKVEEMPKRTANSNDKRNNSSGYMTPYDYSYGKYKGDYKTSRESSHAVLEKTLNEKEEHGTFTPSPIISPVFGVLNENYKKEDIVNKASVPRNTTSVLDLDSVRRKAYGTLEDDIESSLDMKNEIIEEPEFEDEFDEDEGISINDLLVDSQEDDVLEEINDQTDIELFNVVNNDKLDEEIKEEKEDRREFENVPQEEIELNDESDISEMDKPVVRELEKIEVKEKRANREKKDTTKEVLVENIDKKEENESLGEEDLFDLIDSLYEGKGE